MVTNTTVQTDTARKFFTIWFGGDIPVAEDAEVLVIYRKMVDDQPAFANGWAKDFNWQHDPSNSEDDIVAFRLQPMPVTIIPEVIASNVVNS